MNGMKQEELPEVHEANPGGLVFFLIISFPWNLKSVVDFYCVGCRQSKPLSSQCQPLLLRTSRHCHALLQQAFLRGGQRPIQQLPKRADDFHCLN